MPGQTENKRILIGSAGTDACTVPVLSPEEAAKVAGTPIPAPHPWLSDQKRRSYPKEFGVLKPGQHTEEILKEMGISGDELASILRSGAIGKAGSKL